MKTTFKKLMAISLATLTLASAFCFTSFAAEDKGEEDTGKYDAGYYCGDISQDYKNGEIVYDDNGYTFFDEWTEYNDSFFNLGVYLACE